MQQGVIGSFALTGIGGNVFSLGQVRANMVLNGYRGIQWNLPAKFG